MRHLSRLAAFCLVLAAVALLAEPLLPGGHRALAPGGAVLSARTGSHASTAVTDGPTTIQPDPDPSAAILPAAAIVPAIVPPTGASLAQRYRRVGEPLPPTAPERLTGYVWPLARGRITVPFGPASSGTRVVDGQRYHDGLDIATFCGDRIEAAHDGIVLAAGRRFDGVVGWAGSLDRYLARLDAKSLWPSLPIVVVVDDGNGYRSMYAHLSRAVVRRGQRLRAGQLIGYEGATGNASGCHLHYGLFSPRETATFKIRADVVKRMLLPATEIARIDPLRALPPRPVTVTYGWGASPPTPTVGEAWATDSSTTTDPSATDPSASARYPGSPTFR